MNNQTPQKLRHNCFFFEKIKEIGERLQANKIILFGSRARGDERERSDVDIAVYGLPEDKHTAFREAVEGLETLLAFDTVFIDKSTSPALLSNIEKDGIIIMDKTNEKLSSYTQALERLEESIEDYNKYSLNSIRDGAIQRFEFCTELAWKTAREYLTDQGYTEINSPKSVMKTAYADHLIDDETVWIDILNSRNLTAHLYDEETSKRIFQKIEHEYRPVFFKLLESLKGRI